MSKPTFRWFQVQAHTKLPRMASVDAARTALSAAGASLTDLKHYSNKASVFQLLLPAETWPGMLDALEGAGLTIDSSSPGSADELIPDKDGDICGTLQLLYLGDDHETRDEVPAVPG